MKRTEISTEINYLNLIDSDAIVEKLQLLGFHDCQMNTPNEVKLALNNWLKVFLYAIEEDPEWFIQKFDYKGGFSDSLPVYEDEFVELDEAA